VLVAGLHFRSSSLSSSNLEQEQTLDLSNSNSTQSLRLSHKELSKGSLVLCSLRKS